MVEGPLKVQCYASPERTEVMSCAVDDDAATVHARVGSVRPVTLEKDEKRLEKWRRLVKKERKLVASFLCKR